jgi:AcrR family transcriptional regulator
MAPKVSKEHREKRRSDLLQSALVCFSEHGYEDTTMDDIVRSAGVSKGMLYTYFSSKEEVFLALISDRTDVFFDQMESAFEKRSSAWEKLRYLLHRTTPMHNESRKWISVYLQFFLSTSRHESRSAFMHQRYERFIDVLANVVEEGKRTGEFREDLDAKKVSALYFAVCDGLHLHFSQLTQLPDNEEVYSSAIDMVHRFVAKD